VAARGHGCLDALERQSLDYEEQEEKIAGLRQDREERKTYARLYYKLVERWVCWLIVLLLAQGIFMAAAKREFLSDSVMMMTLGTTTATIVSILIAVGKYLFGESKKEKSR